MENALHMLQEPQSWNLFDFTIPDTDSIHGIHGLYMEMSDN